MNPCIFCSQLAQGSVRAPWNQPLLESENFLVVPSLGSLVEGWTLMLPKQHYLCFGALSSELDKEAEKLQSEVKRLLRSKFAEPLVVFEHGPSATKHGTGCGVDHAHRHIVPISCDLQALSASLLPMGAEWVPAGQEACVAAYHSGLDYLFLKQEGKQSVLSVSADFGSQVFRKAIAIYLGKPDEFNWREYPRHETAFRTSAILRSNSTQPHVECEHA